MMPFSDRVLPNLLKKPYIRPVRRENKAMTIAVGFTCSDGIVLCADSQMTATDGIKYNGSKIFSYSENQVDAVFAFAGMEVFSKMCIERLAKRILASDINSVEQVLQEEVLSIHETYAPRATISATDYDLSVLVGVRFTGIYTGMALYHIEGPAVSPPIKSFDCIGVGRTVARQAIGLFLGNSLTVQEASRIGVYCLKQTKDHVDACGGPSQVLMLWDADEILGGYDTPYYAEQDYILKIERGFSILFESLRPVFLNFNNTHSFDSSFTKHLKEAAKTIKKVWNTTYGSIVRQEKRSQEELRRFMDDMNKPKGT